MKLYLHSKIYLQFGEFFEKSFQNDFQTLWNIMQPGKCKGEMLSFFDRLFVKCNDTFAYA